MVNPTAASKTFTDPDIAGGNVNVAELDAREENAPAKIGGEELEGLDKSNILPSGTERPRRNVDYSNMESDKVQFTGMSHLF